MTHFGTRTQLLASAALLGLTLATPALAQDTTAAPPATNDQTVTDDNSQAIIVTAQKREEAILEIPQSVTVIGSDTLERQQATDFKDYAALIPGLSLNESNPGNSRIILRGVNTGGVASTVAVYVDETPFGSSSGLVNGAILAGDFDTFDVARIEVLRGPQGTLYGASSLGGVVKFVTNKPELGVVNGRARAGIEFTKDGEMGWNTSGAINAPLGDKVAVRGSAYYRRDGGYIDARAGALSLGAAGSLGAKDINDDRIWGGRASVLFKPVEPLEIRLTAISQTIDVDAQSTVEVDPDSQRPVDGDLIQTVFIPESTKTKYRVYNGTIDYDFGFASLLSSTSYARLKQDLLIDLTPALGPALTLIFGDFATLPLGAQQDQFTGYKKFTQEIRLASPSNDRFEWMLGGYYTNEKGLIDQDINATDLLNGGGFATGVPNIGFAMAPTKFREVAGFANGTFHFTDRFDLTGGVRLSHNKQTLGQILGGALFAPTNADENSSEDVFTYSIAPRYELSDQTAIYARVAKGYRPGGPNIIPASAPPGTPTTYGADTIVSYEAGIKTDVGRRLSFDASAYVLKWDNIQLFTIINNVGLNANGGKATSKGIEGTLAWRPLRGLQLTANAAFIDAELDEDAPDAGGFKGDRLPWVPKASFSLSGDYEWPLAATTTAYVGSTFRYVGRQYADFDADYHAETGHQRPIRTYSVVDLRAGVEFGRFAVEAFAKNVTNSHGLTSFTLPEVLLLGGPALPGGAASAAILRPRTIGLSATAHF